MSPTPISGHSALHANLVQVQIDEAVAGGGFVYLGSPYTRYVEGIESAYVEACKAAAKLISRGYPAYSPIAHTHPVAMYGGLDPLNHDLWLEADRPLMDAAAALVVLMLPGWKESLGLAHEIAVFRQAGKPIIYAMPEAL